MNLLLFLVANNFVVTNPSSSSSFCYKKNPESLSGDAEDLKFRGSDFPLFFLKKMPNLCGIFHCSQMA